MRNAILTASVLFVLGACGSDGPTPVHGTIDAEGALASVAGMHDMVAALKSTNGDGAANAVIALSGLGQQLVVPDDSSARSLPTMRQLPTRWPVGTRQSLTGSAICTETGCTFDDYGDDTSDGSYRLNGSIQRSGDHITFDLAYDITDVGLTMHFDLDGDLTASDTLIDGAVHAHGSSTTDDGYHLTFGTDVDYDAIQLDADQCPTSGTLTANIEAEVSGPNGHAAYAAYASATFGPTCGVITTH